MLHGPSLAAVRPEVEGVEAALCPQLVEDGEVGVGVVQVVGVGRVLMPGPLVGAINICRRDTMSFCLITFRHLGISLSNIAFSGLDSSSTESKPLTYWRNLWRSGCEAGSMVASNRGWNRHLMMSWKQSTELCTR